MKKSLLTIIIILVTALSGFAQVAVNTDGSTPDTSAMLDVQSTTKGMLIPRMTQTQRTDIASPATGLLVYQTDAPAGFYFYNGTTWAYLSSVQKIDDLTDGKSDANGSSIFLGIDAGANDDGSDNQNVGVGYQALHTNTTGGANTANGYQTLFSNTTGGGNTANGYQSLYFNTEGNYNTANGYFALNANTLGAGNTANGYDALYFNTSGGANTANGYGALFYNTTGYENTASGYKALYSNKADSGSVAYGYGAMQYADNTTTGRKTYNTAIGYEALRGSTTASANTGRLNTSVGYQSLFSNTTGDQNTANGFKSLYFNTSGGGNTANGYGALYSNTTGGGNTANGIDALISNTEGGFNTANGLAALYSNITGNYNTAIGNNAGRYSTGDSNIFLGNESGYYETGSNKLYIENSDADSASALIYGEFGPDNTTTGNILRTNSTFQIGDPAGTGYAFPTADGTADQVLKTDGSGNLTWSTGGATKIDDLSDAKSDSDGTDDGSSIFLGIDAGANDDGSDNRNVGVGYQALKANSTGFGNNANGWSALQSNISGSYNTADGFAALQANTTGSNNTAIGIRAGYSSTGDGNIFLGHHSGYNETGNNKLYIENSDADSASALIYGEFGPDNTTAGNILRTNSTFQIGDPAGTGYAFPPADGSANQVMQTDGSGALSWVNASSFGAQKIDDLSDAKSDPNGSSLFLGLHAGANDDGTYNSNVGVGYKALESNKNHSGSVAYGYGAMQYADDGTSNIITYNTAIGYEALRGSTNPSANTGRWNTSVGYQTLYSNTSGVNNTATGYQALKSNTEGDWNTANGFGALLANITGDDNTATGYDALFYNTTGSYNTASGREALNDNTTGSYNTATGYLALYSNKADSGSVAYGYGAMQYAYNGTSFGRMTYNTAIGYEALRGSTTASNNTGRYNTSIGYQSLKANTSGYSNTANGYFALHDNTLGGQNTANGTQALFSNTTGNFNTAVGYSAGYSSTGSYNIFLGHKSGFFETGSNKLYIENTDANANNALIYGEFGSDNTATDNMLRINGELQVNSGNVQVSERLTAPTSGTDADLKPYIYGSLKDSDGSFYTAESTSGFTSTLESTGVYKITFNSYSSDKNYLVIANALRTSAPVILTYEKNIGYFRIRAWDLSGNLVNTYLNFVVYKK